MLEGRRKTRRIFSRKTPNLPRLLQRQEDGRESKDGKRKLGSLPSFRRDTFEFPVHINP